MTSKDRARIRNGLPRLLSSKKICLPMQKMQFNPLVGKILWERKWQPTPVFLPGKSHGQRSLEGYSPWNHKRVKHDLMTKQQQQRMRNTNKMRPTGYLEIQAKKPHRLTKGGLWIWISVLSSQNEKSTINYKIHSP